MVAVIPDSFSEAYINQHIALARPVNGFLIKYVAWFLACKDGGQKQLQNLQRGMTKVGLGLDDIRNIWIPLPPIEEQYEIVKRIESLFNISEEMEIRYKTGQSYIDKITQSILAKAFRGELVPQDPNDEPASVLLERIRKERKERGTV